MDEGPASRGHAQRRSAVGTDSQSGSSGENGVQRRDGASRPYITVASRSARSAVSDSGAPVERTSPWSRPTDSSTSRAHLLTGALRDSTADQSLSDLPYSSSDHAAMDRQNSSASGRQCSNEGLMETVYYGSARAALPNPFSLSFLATPKAVHDDLPRGLQVLPSAEIRPDDRAALASPSREMQNPTTSRDNFGAQQHSTALGSSTYGGTAAVAGGAPIGQLASFGLSPPDDLQDLLNNLAQPGFGIDALLDPHSSFKLAPSTGVRLPDRSNQMAEAQSYNARGSGSGQPLAAHGPLSTRAPIIGHHLSSQLPSPGNVEFVSSPHIAFAPASGSPFGGSAPPDRHASPYVSSHPHPTFRPDNVPGSLYSPHGTRLSLQGGEDIEAIASWGDITFFISLHTRYQHALVPFLHRPSFAWDILQRRDQRDEAFRGLLFSIGASNNYP